MIQKRSAIDPSTYVGSGKAEEIHKLANKTKKAVGAEKDKASCHSDYVDPDTAKKVQSEKLVTLGVGIKTNDSVR